MMAKKMQWLIDAINSGQCHKVFDFCLAYSSRTHGTVCMPTGTGKTGIMIQDIISKIGIAFFSLNSYSGQRFIINISCPTLRLCEQFMSDLFEVIDGVFNDRTKEMGLVLNSSDHPINYKTFGVSIYSGVFSDALPLSLKDKKIIIVASCHKSMKNYVDTIKGVKSVKCISDIYNYIDESHMLSVKGILEFDDCPYIDLSELIGISTNTYLFSATPDYKMTLTANKGYNENDLYIYHMFPLDAIKNNIILPPRIRCFRSKNIVNIPFFEYVLEESRQYGGYRKILITLKNTEDLRGVRGVLTNMNYKVFSACAADGFTGEDNITNAVDFAEAVDKWQGDCFVLQIRQLTQGTDIRTLTDCIIPVANDIYPKTYRHVLQTIGRVLRVGPNERGIDYDHRVKKAGNVFFMILPNACEEKETSLRRFALRYYGMECTEYSNNFKTPAEITYDIDQTKRCILRYIEENITLIKFSINVCNIGIEKEAADIVRITDADLYGLDIRNIPEYHLLDNRSLIRYTVNLLHQKLN